MHEHLVKLGIPVKDPGRPDYIATLLPGSVEVTAQEARQIRSFVEYICQGPAWGSTAKEMEVVTPQGTFIGGPCANTVTFWKRGEGDWCYKKYTWENPAAYFPNPAEHSALSLLELLDSMEGQYTRWRDWKTAHPGVFELLVKPAVMVVARAEALEAYRGYLGDLSVYAVSSLQEARITHHDCHLAGVLTECCLDDGIKGADVLKALSADGFSGVMALRACSVGCFEGLELPADVITMNYIPTAARTLRDRVWAAQ